MKFDAIDVQNMNYKKFFSIVNEAVDLSKNFAINVSNTALKIALSTDKVVAMNKLKPISNPIMFRKGDVPTEDGLFSEVVFGSTPEERRWNCAYIELNGKFFHPYVFEVLCKLSKNIGNVAAGLDSWKIDETGKLKKVKPEEEGYDPSNTGLDWLVEHYHELKFEMSKSYTHNQFVQFIDQLSEEETFISKWIVIPVFYRDVDFSGGTREVPEINDFYKRLMQYVNALKVPSLGEFANKTKYNIQICLRDIRKYGQSLVESKKGFLKRSVIGKSNDFGARNVISQPSYAHCDRPEDSMIDIFHSGFPIATCCSMAYPFIEHWILEFISKEFETRQRKAVLVKENGKYHMEYAKLGDVMAFYTPQYIEKNVEQFMHTYGARFKPLVIPMEDGSEAYILFTGRPYSKDPLNPKVSEVGQRPMTWTDLLYIACVETLEYGGKMAYITRYPLVDYFGTFPSCIRVTSTVNTTKMTIGDRYYPFYPVVDPNASQAEVSTMFVDTVTMDNVYLGGLGGDYDGDMVSEKMCFTEEANDEAYAIMTDPKHFVSINGDLMRKIDKEAYLTFYNMTCA